MGVEAQIARVTNQRVQVWRRSPFPFRKGESWIIFLQDTSWTPAPLSSCRNYSLLAHSIFTWRMQKASILALLSKSILPERWMTQIIEPEVQLLII